jgi:hypothetical protein
MEPSDIERALRAAIATEISRCGEGHVEVAYRLNDLAKYLASHGRVAEAEPLMEQAVFVIAMSTLKGGLSKPPDNAAPIFEGYEILLKILGLDRHQRKARLQVATDRAKSAVEADMQPCLVS